MIKEAIQALFNVRSSFQIFKTKDLLEFVDYLRETTSYINYMLANRFDQEGIEEIEFDNVNNHPHIATLKRGTGEIKEFKRVDDNYVRIKPKKEILDK